MIGITAPIVKHSIEVERADDIAQAVARRRCTSRRRAAPARCCRRPDRPRGLPRAGGRARPRAAAATTRRCGPNGAQVRKRGAQAIAAARRPVLYAGGGVVHADAAHELRRARPRRRPAGDHDADGARRLPRERPPVAGHARHARHPARQLGDGRGGPDRRRRRAVRRPRDRRAGRVRAPRRRSCTSTSTRRRSTRTSPRTSRSSGDARRTLRGARRRATRAVARPGPAAGLVGADRRLAGRAPAQRAGEPRARSTRRPRSTRSTPRSTATRS